MCGNGSGVSGFPGYSGANNSVGYPGFTDTVRIYNCELGFNVKIGDFTVLGHPDASGRRLPLKIGNNAVIRSHTVIYGGTEIGDNFTTGHGVLIRENCKIGNNVGIGSHTVIENNVTIGNNVRIHSRCFIPQNTVLEDGCWIGPSVTFVNDPHPPCAECMEGPRIGAGARIGAGTVILDHIKIGENALIGAGAVITRDVPPNTVIYTDITYHEKKIGDLKCRYGIKDKPYG